MSADIAGSWMVTQGQANINFVEQQFHGELVYEDSHGDLVSVYAKIEGSFFGENEVEMKVAGPEAPPFFLKGNIYELIAEPNVAYTIVLTDGTTVLGLTRQARME